MTEETTATEAIAPVMEKPDGIWWLQNLHSVAQAISEQNCPISAPMALQMIGAIRQLERDVARLRADARDLLTISRDVCSFADDLRDQRNDLQDRLEEREYE